MVRTCETVIHIFKSHPNKSGIRFVVLPNIKEGLNLCNDKQGTYQRLRRIIDPLLKKHELAFDFSMMFASFCIPDLAQVNITTSIERFQEIYSYIDANSHPDPDYGYSEQILKIAYDKFPYRMEDPECMFKRGLKLRNFLKTYLKNHKLQEGEKCVIVSHSSFLTSLSSKGYDYLKNDLIEPCHMNNC